MYVTIHARDEYKDSLGRKMEVWGEPSFRQATSQRGNPLMQITLSCDEQIGTGQRNMFADQKLIHREATLSFGQEDAIRFLRELVAWEGLVVNEEDALRLIRRLSSDMLSARNASPQSDFENRGQRD